MQCVRCNGTKKIMGLFGINSQTGKCMPVVELPCHYCNATGKVPEDTPLWIEEGKKLSEFRRSFFKHTLRDEARRRGMKPSDLSDMEIGKTKPIFPPEYRDWLREIKKARRTNSENATQV